jgi:hypothetical protein
MMNCIHYTVDASEVKPVIQSSFSTPVFRISHAEHAYHRLLEEIQVGRLRSSNQFMSVHIDTALQEVLRDVNREEAAV